jgi:uncharacterized protein (DUF849 family)
LSKTIITAAITGAIHTPGMSPYLPISPEEIVEDAVRACEAGAAVVHIHARDPKDGRPSADVELMKGIVSEIKERSDVIICITTGGSIGMPLEDRIASIPALKPELASCNAGSINFVIEPAARKLKPVYEWELPYLNGTKDLIFSNTFLSFERYINEMYNVGAMPEFEVYDVGMINNLAYFLNEGILRKPIYIQFVMGILGGIPASVENLVFMLKTAREQLGDFNWSVAAAGRNQFIMTTAALTLGGNVRVGLEDNLYLAPKVLAKSSAEQVMKIRGIAEALFKEIATPDEAREILGLKGKSEVAF